MCHSAALFDLNRLAQTIQQVAAGEGRMAQAALAWVIRNRQAEAVRWMARAAGTHPQFGDGSLEAACRSVLSDAGMARVGLGVARPDCRVLALACLIVSGDWADPTGGAVHFHRHDVSPAWARAYIPLALIGERLFYGALASRAPDRRAAISLSPFPPL